jgi:hypothetical protein
MITSALAFFLRSARSVSMNLCTERRPRPFFGGLRVNSQLLLKRGTVSAFGHCQQRTPHLLMAEEQRMQPRSVA